MPSVLDQPQPSADSRSGRGRNTFPLFFRYFNGDCAVTTPTSSRDLAEDFPLFPLVRYPPRRNSANCASALPPPGASRPCAAETDLRRPVDRKLPSREGYDSSL